MATLPLYQPTGFLPLDVPRLDRADVKETQAQLTTITSSLDRMSQFAFKKAEEQAEREGLQYGAENQPTLEQIAIAQQQGKSIQELFAEPGTTFGNAARKIQAGQLRSELEVVGRKKLTDLSVLIDAGSFNLADVQKEITALTNGYAKSISSVSPEEGLRFRASMGSAGNAVYNKAAEKAGAIYTEGVKALAQDSLNTTTQILTDIYASEQDPAMILQRSNNERSRIYDIASKTGDVKFLQDSMKDFKSRQVNSMIEYLSKPEISKNQTEVFSRLQTGKVGKLSELYKTLDKNEVITAYGKKMSEQNQIINATRSMEKMQNEGFANNLLIEYFSPNTNQLRKRDIGIQLAKTNVLSVDQMERFLNPEVKDGDPYAFSNLKYQVVTGMITDPEELRSIATRSGFSGKQYSSLANDLISRTKQDETKAYKMGSQSAGFGDIRPGKNKNNEHIFNKERKIFEYYDEAKAAAINDRGSFNPQDTMLVAIERYNNNDKKNNQKASAQTKIEAISNDIKKRKKQSSEFVITVDTSLDDLLTKKIINNDEFVELNKLQTILRREVQ
jgi:hypothetical protein